MAVVLALFGGSLLLIMREVQLRTMNARIAKVIRGTAGRTTGLQDLNTKKGN